MLAGRRRSEADETVGRSEPEDKKEQRWKQGESGLVPIRKLIQAESGMLHGQPVMRLPIEAAKSW